MGFGGSYKGFVPYLKSDGKPLKCSKQGTNKSNSKCGYVIFFLGHGLQ